MEDTSGYDKSGVRLTWLGVEDFLSVLLPPGSGVVPAISGMVNWLAHAKLLSPSFIWWIPISSHLSLSRPHSTITYEHEVKSSLSISTSNDYELTLSTAYTEYCIHRVLHTPSTAYTEYCIHRVLHTPSTAYTEYCIHRVLHTPSTAYTEYCIIARSTVSRS